MADTSSIENFDSGQAATERGTAFAFILLLIGSTLLALGPWLVRLADTGPVASAFWRLSLAIPVLFLIAIRTEPGGLKAARAVMGVLALGGLFFAADLASWHVGILYTKLANATLFGNIASLLFPLVGFYLLRQRPSRMQIAALVLALFGSLLLMGQSYELSPDNIFGDLLCVLAGLFYTLYLVVMMRARERLQSWTVLALSTAAGALPLLITAWALGETVLPTNWTPLIALAMMSQVIGQGALIYALGKLSPLIVGLVLLTQPIVSALSGWWAFGETLGGIEIFGAVLIAAALVLVQLKPRASKRIEPI